MRTLGLAKWLTLWSVLAIGLLLLPLAPRPAAAQTRETPRLVLALYDSSELPKTEFLPTRNNLIHSLAEMPLNYLGLRLRYLDVNTDPLPDAAEMRNYLGVISWFQDDQLKNASQYLGWVREQIAAGRRFVVLGRLGAGSDLSTDTPLSIEELTATYAAMGLRYFGLPTDNPLLLSVREKASEMVEFERTLDGELSQYERIQSISPSNRVYLRINRSDLIEGDSDVVVTGSWGGFVLGGYEYYEQARTFQKRWRINPFILFEEAFGLAGYPRPDVSTINGSRVFYTHVDGDGFNNISEIDFYSLSSEILLNRFIRRYDLPFTISIVVNDIDPKVAGGERQLRVAREIFAERNVEPASHTYTHPFDWTEPVDLEHEITGALDFLNRHVATPERPVKVILWSGATNPGVEAVARTDAAGLLNINGGDGRFDSAANSHANLAALTTQVGPHTQFYTSNANDNIYGNDWTGPYYGLRNVIQTWERTETPRRLSALNVYYHIFTGEKHSAVRALHEVYDYAIKLNIAPVFTGEYIQLVQGFQSTKLVREAEASWRVRDNGTLRTIRFDAEQRYPNLEQSQNVLGYWHYQGSLYVFVGQAPESLITLTSSAPTRPYLAHASHQVLDWQLTDSTLSLTLDGIGRKRVSIGNLRPNTDYDVVEQGGGERRIQVRAGADGTLAWSSDTKGRLRLTIANLSVGRQTGLWELALSWLRKVSGS
ncbi:MAG: hypothetical protein HY329_28205 [Chloroflexi bacterium]|nr:hypothetical protein [Chloroflexota bacterium]